MPAETITPELRTAACELVNSAIAVRKYVAFVAASRRGFTDVAAPAEAARCLEALDAAIADLQAQL